MKVKAFSTIVAAVVLATAVAAQLPAISWTCPMHPDVLEDKKGTCGICGMDLEAVRLVTMYTCPVHAVIEQGTPGKCRICSRDLVQKTAALTFTCAGNREISQLEPGTCADGAPMIPRYNARAHGDHNAKHGGTFFMAPDNWHHIEGTYPAAGRFRVYVYDDFSRPLGASDAKQVRGRVVTKEVFDSKTGTTRELASAPLVLARNGSFFEARIEPIALPAKMTAKIAFRSGDKESRFDFSFPDYSRDLPASVAPNTSKSTAPAPNAPIAPSRTRRTVLRADFADRYGGQAQQVVGRPEGATVGGGIAHETGLPWRDLCPGSPGQGSGVGDSVATARRRRRGGRGERQADRARGISARQLRRSGRRRESPGRLPELQRRDSAARFPPFRTPVMTKGGGRVRAGHHRGLVRAARKRARGHHLEIHLQRRRVSGLSEPMRPLPHRWRRRTDVAPEVRGCVSLGRVAAHRVDDRLRGRLSRGTRHQGGPPRLHQSRPSSDFRARARYRAELGDRRHA